MLCFNCFLSRPIFLNAENRQQLSQKLFKQIKSASSDRLSYLIPETRFYKHGRKLRNSENLDVFKCNTNRFKNSFFPTNVSYFNSYR